PDRLRPITLFGPEEGLRHLAHGIVPGEALPFACTARAVPLQGRKEAVGMMNALGMAPDFFANDPQRVAVVLGAAHAPDCVFIEEFDVEGAGRGAGMRADRPADLDIGANVHNASLSQTIPNV